MSYKADVHTIQISCPGDILEQDLDILRRGITRWNQQHGQDSGVVFIPVAAESAAPLFGQHPQDTINDAVTWLFGFQRGLVLNDQRCFMLEV